MKDQLLLFAYLLAYCFNLIFYLLLRSLFSLCDSFIFFTKCLHFPLSYVRFRDVEICFCWDGGISWSNSGFYFLLLASCNLALLVVRILVAYSCMILQSAKKLYENILGASTNSLAHIQVSTLKFQNLGLAKIGINSIKHSHMIYTYIYIYIFFRSTFVFSGGLRVLKLLASTF